MKMDNIISVLGGAALCLGIWNQNLIEMLEAIALIVIAIRIKQITL